MNIVRLGSSGAKFQLKIENIKGSRKNLLLKSSCSKTDCKDNQILSSR